ncbi:DUF202 domain-containing protein [Zunongwangia sp.]|uniref:DUF202 domain-containing protein n=1 Tax=Zunongwangia sp. TaxID=1965325 RepID=UPI003AA87203
MKKVKIKNPFKTRIIDEKLVREHLALERTKLANERTLLSYIRSSLYLLLGGFALLQIESYDQLDWVAYVAFACSLIFLTIGISRYISLGRKLNKLLRTEESSPEIKP